MNSLFALAFSLFIYCFSQGQNIRVLNAQTQEPIFGVAIYNVNKSKSCVTNFKGEADLDDFLEHEIIYFKHLSHQLKTITKKQLSHFNSVFLNSNTQGLHEIVISASKFKQNIREIPQKIINIKAEQISFSNPQTSADLLEHSGQVYVQKSQLGGGSPMIRGFSTNRLLITVDGVRMNNAIFRGGNIQNVISIDPFSIQNTEVILGSGSVIYGSDAIGGVMSFYTQTPILSKSDSLLVTSRVITRYASASQEQTGHFDMNLGWKKWAFVTNVSYSDFDDLRMGNHGPDDYLRHEFVKTTNGVDFTVENTNPLVQKTTGYNQLSLLQKAHFKAHKTLSFDLGLFYTATSEYPRYDRLIKYNGPELHSAEWNYGPQKWWMSNLQMTKLSSRAPFYDAIKATLAYQNFQESRKDRDYQSLTRNVRKEVVDAYSMNVDFEKMIHRKLNLFYGMEYIYNRVKSSAHDEHIQNNRTRPIISRYPNGATFQTLAAYASIKYKPNSKFVFQSGARFNQVLSKADFTANNRFLSLPFRTSENQSNALTGTAGFSWFPNKTIQWKLNASTAFRAPNIDDMAKVFDSEPGFVIVPNDNLKPEYAYGGELGLKLNFDNQIILDMNTYYTYLDNALVRRYFTINGQSEVLYDGELSRVQALQNTSKLWVHGFEIGAKVKVTNDLALTSQYTITNGMAVENRMEVPARHVAPHFGNTHIVWHSEKLKLDFFTNYNSEIPFNQLAPSEIKKDFIYALDAEGNPFSPSWCTINVRTQYQLKPTISVTASLENISDQRYKTYASGIAASGRNFIVSLKYSL